MEQNKSIEYLFNARSEYNYLVSQSTLPSSLFRQDMHRCAQLSVSFHFSIRIKTVREETHVLWFLFLHLLSQDTGKLSQSFSSAFLRVLSHSFFFPQLFMRALSHEKCGAIFQESYSLVAFQYGQRNLAISNYSSEVVSFPECQHSLAPVEGIKILSPIMTTECFLQTVILHRGPWGRGKHNETKTKVKQNQFNKI